MKSEIYIVIKTDEDIRKIKNHFSFLPGEDYFLADYDRLTTCENEYLYLYTYNSVVIEWCYKSDIFRYKCYCCSRSINCKRKDENLYINFDQYLRHKKMERILDEN